MIERTHECKIHVLIPWVQITLIYEIIKHPQTFRNPPTKNCGFFCNSSYFNLKCSFLLYCQKYEKRESDASMKYKNCDIRFQPNPWRLQRFGVNWPRFRQSIHILRVDDMWLVFEDCTLDSNNKGLSNEKIQ